ncbi:MAG: CDC48 family AAA ATPase [Nitrososphaerota archaeon]|jgi:transitional endoplasmic reticulum ATPase|uniref:CDC48 family AAA ATPase n=1 Tax=Candidatus Bathycorpusculum sp. TaxID=2994959 RepID=UPI002835F36B|nr:CDC48 family AAA ATPase [Candidatus Termitimicrobium sp.]MCL2432036.1 CDC48 family AAA ATPase [Candidatus Termitimicrobium sp.]MDR0492135.1 CDC48 family AAA ATPase [Nitrososphaerota archaeon]
MSEVQLRVGDARQRDVGRGIARIDQRTMQKLGISAGDVIEIVNKRTTSAIAWPAYSEDQNRDIIRIDGFTRKNSGVAINEYVVIRPAKVKTALALTLAPVDMRLNVDDDFTSFVRNRLMERTLVEGDTTLVMMLGHAIPFTVSKTRPHGIIKVTTETRLTILNEPAPEGKGLPRTTYEDIGGLHEELQRVREMVELPLRHPELFQRLGIEPPKGVLLHGPPGCGKTLLARAVANESEANFYSINGPEIMSKFYGESEARLREIFQQAQQNAPSIIFVDELDAIAPKREEVTGEVERRVVAQLLALMDGLSGRGNVIVIGATNRPSALDPALRRPGRFDREIEISVPDKKGRSEVLQIHTRGMPLAENVDLNKLSEMTHGYTGADLSALSRETAMKALRRYLPQINLEEERIPPEVLEKMEVTMEDFMGAYKEVTPTAMREVYIEVSTVHWEDAGGLDDVKQRLKEAVEWPLKNPEMFTNMGIRAPKGILMYGPPGCGKTLLARAVATESEANFISIKGPEVFSKWVGESEKAIREVFRKARMAAPAVIFLDEIDSLTPQRGLGMGDSGMSERVISQLLTEMDGITTLQDIVVIAATNRPDMVDKAVIRPGRLDRLIYVPEPDEKSRLQIFKIYTKNMPISADVNLDQLATQTKYYSGADIESLCREAAMHSLRRDITSRSVTMRDFQDALKEMGPSIQPDMEKWYKGFMQQIRQVQKPATPVA